MKPQNKERGFALAWRHSYITRYVHCICWCHYITRKKSNPSQVKKICTSNLKFHKHRRGLVQGCFGVRMKKKKKRYLLRLLGKRWPLQGRPKISKAKLVDTTWLGQKKSGNAPFRTTHTHTQKHIRKCETFYLPNWKPVEWCELHLHLAGVWWRDRLLHGR